MGRSDYKAHMSSRVISLDHARLLIIFVSVEGVFVVSIGYFFYITLQNLRKVEILENPTE